MEELAFRQVHLDFHTSGLIPDVGARFDAHAFVDALRRAHVNSVTCFAKCHHGYSYYPTRVGVRHPTLKRDLLGEQVEACHRAGIRVPAYISVVWDEHIAMEHQEWLQVDRDGKLAGRSPQGDRGWRWLCMNTPYADYVAAQTEEVLRMYPVDGIFFDIVMQTRPGCVCNQCQRDLRARGESTSDAQALSEQSLRIARDFMHRMTALVHGIRPQASVFYNSRLRVSADGRAGVRPELPQYTHVEIESLPTGGWGYNHFPLYSRYFQPLGKDLMGMTARFHKSWADFGGLKNRAALEYECFSMLAAGAKCSVGDQLHPSGELEGPAYERIGDVFQSVALKEPWCREAVARAEIGVILAQGQKPDATAGEAAEERDTDEGMMRMLLENKRCFHFLDNESELADYRLVVLPDSIRVGPALAVRLRDYLAQGGKLLLTGDAGLDTTGTTFSLREMGITSLDRSPWSTAYLRVQAESDIASGVEPMDHVIYERGRQVAAAPGTQVLAHVVPPYFNRDAERFSSHAQTPPSLSPGEALPADSAPAVTLRGSVGYIAFPLARAYRRSGNRVYRTLMTNMIDALVPERLISADLPSSAQATVIEQPRSGGRVVAHLLYYGSERRTSQLDIIEDVVTLRDVHVSVRTDFQPMRAYEAPSGNALDVQWRDGVASVTLPRLEGHAMLVFEP